MGFARDFIKLLVVGCLIFAMIITYKLCYLLLKLRLPWEPVSSRYVPTLQWTVVTLVGALVMGVVLFVVLYVAKRLIVREE